MAKKEVYYATGKRKTSVARVYMPKSKGVFTINKKWTLRFAEIYARNCGIPFTINARFDHFDEEIVSALRNFVKAL